MVTVSLFWRGSAENNEGQVQFNCIFTDFENCVALSRISVTFDRKRRELGHGYSAISMTRYAEGDESDSRLVQGIFAKKISWNSLGIEYLLFCHTICMLDSLLDIIF